MKVLENRVMTQPLEEIFARPRSISPAPPLTEEIPTWDHPFLAAL
jgi:hypothetical protein